MRTTTSSRLSLRPYGNALLTLFLFSFVANTLLLVQPVFMLQVYDRVLTSGSTDTLLYITIFAGLALLLLGVTDAVRSLIAGRLATRLEVATGADAFLASVDGQRSALGDIQPLRDLQTLKNFIASRAIFAFFDLPFSPLFIGLLYFVHPNLFWLTVGGAVALAILTLANEKATAAASSRAGKHTMRANLAAQSFARNAESLSAMGMINDVIWSWGAEEAEALAAQDRAARLNAVFAALSRTIRIALQIAIYAYGGYLVLAGQMTAGMIFAASLISGRGLQPIDQLIGSWRSITDAAKAWKRLRESLDAGAAKAELKVGLPEPNGRIHWDRIVVFPPNGRLGAEPLLKKVSAQVEPGECLAVIGPSGAGKSTLVRALVAAIEPQSGCVRIDGADIRHWDREALGRFVGYLSQDVDLLPGTIAQNIARFRRGADDAAIVAAARKAHVHDLIQFLPDGYNTRIGPGALQLSGGQRQRIGLARAFFGTPKLLVLDEPNANLDADGDLALEGALATAKEDGVTVVIVTQRRPIAERADKLLVMREGAVEDFGSRLEVMARQVEKIRAAQAKRADAEQKVVAGRFPPVREAVGGDGATNAIELIQTS